MDSRKPVATKPPTTTLCEVVALMVACRRLAVVSLGPPALVIVVPWLLELYLWLVNGLTAGHGLFCTLLTLAFTLLGIDTIRRYAPTRQQRDDALDQSKIILPIMSFGIARSISLTIAEWRALNAISMFTPKFDIGISFRVACCMLLLNAAVVSRFLGSASVVRCSSVLLRSHPITTSLRSYWQACTSFDALVDLIAMPSDMAGTLLEPSFATKQYGGLRRYQRPSTAAYIAQFIITTAIGTVLALVAPIATTEDETGTSIFALFHFAWVISVLVVSLLVVSLDGTSHELDPKLYMVGLGEPGHSVLPFPEKKTLVVSSVFIAVISIGATYLSLGESLPWSTSRSGALVVVMEYLMGPLIIFFYLLFIEEAARRMLCVPNVSLARLLEALSEDTSLETQLDIALFSFLHGDEDLVRFVSTPSKQPGMSHVDVAEMKKIEQCTNHMARILLGIDRHHLVRRSQLELDMLRVYILELLGGGPQESLSGGVVTRHQDAVKQWSCPHASRAVRSVALEPAVVPLVRAMCSYAGGVGEALTLCTLPTNHPRRLEIEDSSTAFATWCLPPGTRACGEWAVMGAARLLVSSFACSKASVSDWKASPLATLVPVVLQSSYTLRKGVTDYANVGKSEAAGDIHSSVLKEDNKTLRDLFEACDRAALLVIDTLVVYEGPRQLKIPVHHDCQLWLEYLMSR